MDAEHAMTCTDPDIYDLTSLLRLREMIECELPSCLRRLLSRLELTNRPDHVSATKSLSDPLPQHDHRSSRADQLEASLNLARSQVSPSSIRSRPLAFWST